MVKDEPAARRYVGFDAFVDRFVPENRAVWRAFAADGLHPRAAWHDHVNLPGHDCSEGLTVRSDAWRARLVADGGGLENR